MPRSSWTKSLPKAFQQTKKRVIPDSNLISFDLDICGNELVQDFNHMSILLKITIDLTTSWYLLLYLYFNRKFKIYNIKVKIYQELKCA